MDPVRTSRVAFAVIKISVSGVPYFLMRANPKWKDVNFVGGHSKERDRGSLETTARRELWEEVPSIRTYSSIRLEKLTEKLKYGPIYSRSKGDKVRYIAQFFLLKIDDSAEALVEGLGERTKNVWVSQEDLLHIGRIRLSGLVAFLDSALPGGLKGIPFSSAVDLPFFSNRTEHSDPRQISFNLK